jgi:ABC-2 type transport system ATP-binding protein
MSSEPLLQVTDLHRYYGPVHAVRGLDFDLRRGQVLGLLGANGAGKSTTMAMLAGVLAPSAGRIRVAGHDLLQRPLAAKARLGYLPEVPPLFAELSVDEYLHHCARLRAIPRQRLAAAVADAKARCGLAQSGSRLLGNLSKGYRQRVGIAQAIVHEPDLLILDEPTAGLDPAQLREIRALIRELGKDHAVVLSTHVLPEAQAICDSVQIIHQGALALAAPMNALPGSDGSHRVRLARAPSAADIAALDMVEAVAPANDGALTVRLRGGDDGLARFAAACCAGGWGLLELTPERRSLEDVFIAVVCGDDTPGGGAPA